MTNDQLEVGRAYLHPQHGRVTFLGLVPWQTHFGYTERPEVSWTEETRVRKGIVSAKHLLEDRGSMAKERVKALAKEAVLTHGPANILEFGPELIASYSPDLSGSQVDVVAIEAHVQARRVYAFLGYVAPECDGGS